MEPAVTRHDMPASGMPPQKETTHRNQNQETQTAAQPAQMPKAHGIDMGKGGSVSVKEGM